MKRSKSLAVVALAIMLAGFSGKEKFIELEGYLNARSSAQFRKIDNNVRSVLATGTRGEILESKKMASGNYGLRVKVLSGEKTGREYWVYYNVNNPDMALYDTAPQDWKEFGRQTTTLDKASGVETVRETPAIDTTSKATEATLYKPKDESRIPKTAGTETAQDAIDAITAGNDAIKNVPVPIPRPECVECSQNVEPEDGVDPGDVALKGGSIPMNSQCGMFINRKGEFGELGEKAMSIMNERRYKDLFTKSNALGSYCPRFDSMSDQEKLQAWTWFWTSLANEETQCVIQITHAKTSKGGRKLNPAVGYGLYAAEKDDHYRMVSQGRGSECRDIRTGAGQLRCAISTMAKHTLSEGKNPRTDKSGYWGPARPWGQMKINGRWQWVDRGAYQIMPHMKRFNACF